MDDVTICKNCGKPQEDGTIHSPMEPGQCLIGEAIGGPLNKQVGGAHYKDLPIQPVEYCQRNGLQFCEASVVKYVSRHREKNGAQDIQKAIHFLEMLLEIEYPDHVK